MSLTASDITRIARLARLDLPDSEKSRLTDQLNTFFEVVEAIRAVDTTGFEPLAHPVSIHQEITLRLQPDRVSECNSREDNQRSAPAVERGLFLVPKVIE